jgi:hypothetical protein
MMHRAHDAERDWLMTMGLGTIAREHTQEPIMPRTAKPRSGRKAKPATMPPAAATEPAKAKRLSGLDAAAQVLRAAGEPLNVGAIMERIAAEGLWQTSGKTPGATIYAAMIREIAAKGTAARFQKVDRGRFAAAG